MTGEVADIGPVLVPGICGLFYWAEDACLVFHLTFIGQYPDGIIEGVPRPADDADQGGSLLHT